MKKAQPNSVAVSDSEIYEIVNLVLDEFDEAMRNDGFKVNPYKYLLDRDLEPPLSEDDSIVFTKTDTIFTKEDLIFISSQISDRKNFKFHADSIKSKQLLSSDLIKEMIENSYKDRIDFKDTYLQKYGSGCYQIGLPLFSKDKKMVVLRINQFGSGETRVYKKVNEKWKYYCSFGTWIA